MVAHPFPAVASAARASPPGTAPPRRDAILLVSYERTSLLMPAPGTAFAGCPPAPSEISKPRCACLPLLSSPAAGAAASDQQKRHQKQQRPHRKDGGDQNSGSQRHRAHAQHPAASSSKHTAHTSFTAPEYAPAGPVVTAAGTAEKQKTPGAFAPGVLLIFSSPARPAGA